MSLPPELRSVLTAETARAWQVVAPVVPAEAYLVDGTAIAVHLGHRISRDLDFYLSSPLDLRLLAGDIGRAGIFHPETLTSDTLNGYLEGAKLQFLCTADERLLDEPTAVAGIRIAAIGDLLATKLNAIVGRATLRDYFDLMEIEKRTQRSVEEGVGLALARYRPDLSEQFADNILRALGYLGDVADDPQLPVPRTTIVAYWRRRQPEVARNLSRY